VQSEQQLSPGDQLELTFRVPTDGLDVSVRVDVRHVAHLVDDPIEQWEAGCEFRAVTPAARERLAALLVEHDSATDGGADPAPSAPGETPPTRSPRPAVATTTPFDIGAEMIRGINRGEFVVHYQPIVSFKTHQIVEIEALLRWQHPERGMVAPARFLPLAEQSGLISTLGHRVLDQACREVRGWQELGGMSSLSLAINLSARQLQDPDIVEDIAQTLWHARLDPAHLSVEVTENGLLEDPDATGETLRRFKRLGIRLVLDDFGTGPSSLRRLAQLPLDALKIDTSLTSGLEHGDGTQATLVRSIIGVAQGLGLEVTAEGIESWGQQTMLRRLGCQRGQGYFFAHPQGGEHIPDLLSPSLPALLGPASGALSA
jgi:EAL domain-containing protein (putative c-di-GMP-specific phosphodiesterase class I)